MQSMRARQMWHSLELGAVSARFGLSMWFGPILFPHIKRKLGKYS